eukprot:g39693.t1
MPPSGCGLEQRHHHWYCVAILRHHLASTDIVTAMSSYWDNLSNAAATEAAGSSTGLKPNTRPTVLKQLVIAHRCKNMDQEKTNRMPDLVPSCELVQETALNLLCWDPLAD